MNGNSTLADALAEQTKDVAALVDRRLRDHRTDEAIKRTEHLEIIKTILNEHRSDVLSEVAVLMADKENAPVRAKETGAVPQLEMER